MSTKTKLSRRHLFKAGIGTAGGLIAGKAVADVCGLESTGAQPLGPFFPRAGTPNIEVREDKNPETPIYLANDNDLSFVKSRSKPARGQVVYIKGVISSETCEPITNANIVIWQASHQGRYNHNGDAQNEDFKHPETGKVIKRELDEDFQYWGRAVTNKKGEYIFKTIVPGFYPADLAGGWYRPPHIHLMVSATGYPQFVTQTYFKGEELVDNEWIQKLNERDFLLQSSSLTKKERDHLVVEFKKSTDSATSDGLVGNFDIVLKA